MADRAQAVLIAAILVVIAGCVAIPAASSAPTAASTPAAEPTASALSSVSSVSADANDPTAQSVDVSAAASPTSVDAQPEIETRVDATDAVGNRYELVLPAFALRAPTTITLRPLSSAVVPGATFVAGVEIGPSGLHLSLPGTLTMTPSSVVASDASVSLEYSGAESPVAVLGALAPSSSQAGYAILLTHFSGGIVAGLDEQGENLWLQNGTFNTDTASGRRAQAEPAIHVLEWADKQGRISHDDAVSSEASWARQLLDAEREVVESDPSLKGAVDSGDIERAGEIETELAGVVRIVMELGKVGETAEVADALRSAIALEGTFARNVVTRLDADPAFQAKLDSGLVSNMDDIRAVLDALLGIERSQEIIGDSATSQVIQEAISRWLKRFVASVLESCHLAPLDVALATGFVRMAEALGDADSAAALQDCLWQDFRIDQTLTGSQGGATWTAHLSGVKCSRVAGDWLLTYDGTVDAAGMIVSNSGKFVVHLDENGEGPWDGSATAQVNGRPMGATAHYSGTAEMNSSEPRSLVMRTLAGSGTGYAYGFQESVSVPGTVEMTISVQEGTYCQH